MLSGKLRQCVGYYQHDSQFEGEAKIFIHRKNIIKAVKEIIDNDRKIGFGGTSFMDELVASIEDTIPHEVGHVIAEHLYHNSAAVYESEILGVFEDEENFAEEFVQLFRDPFMMKGDYRESCEKIIKAYNKGKECLHVKHYH